MSVLPKTLPKGSKYSHLNRKLDNEEPTLILNTCLKILHEQTPDQINKWFIENKITSSQLKNQKCTMVITHSENILRTMLVDHQSPSNLLTHLIAYYKNSNKKSYDYCRCLKHFATRDYEFDYILSMAKGEVEEPLSFYLKCRTAIVESPLNKVKKELMGSVIATAQEWFGVCKKLFKGFPDEELIDIFTDTCKSHYLQIKKNQNEQLHGDQFFKVCLIIRRIVTDQKQTQDNLDYYDQEDPLFIQPQRRTPKEEKGRRTPNEQGRRTPNEQGRRTPNKETSAKRIFQRNVVAGLESQDRELIRMLSYRDTNIARLLEKKHDKMIDMIVDEVQEMRSNIELEKQKYIELCREKDEVVSATENMSFLALNYIESNSYENQDKLLRAISSFFSKHAHGQHKEKVERLKENKKNLRLIEIIENQERELD